MRRTLVLRISAAMSVIPISGAGAEHAPRDYCSESGDVCQEVREADADFKFRISLTSQLFKRYRLCVKDPNDTKECHRFRVQEAARGTYADSVSWLKNFQAGPAGDYTVVWKVRGERIGAKLGFHTLPG